MWPVIVQFLRSNPRYVALPFAIVVGFIGFNLESLLRSQEDISSTKHNPKKTVSQIRIERQINQDLSSPDHGLPESPASVLEYRGEPMFDKNK
ncbi:unnamed protein product [Echinostoma caproni]|uniref:Small integral membrane protein 12 n=1 Tax=Echinostoma caproni TaxID=27848 RepID=A0A183B916_9TREM|nr:unnamed protein product [Echinostoma caproni]